ncbi:MAG TPA: hypothetical protein VLL72_06065, partial [Kiloniellales bacterium]|nr:hypothetical protein [Kiloniellales bacterium]
MSDGETKQIPDRTRARRRWPRRLALALGSLLALPIVLLLGAWVLAQTGPGQAWIARGLSDALSEPGEIEVSIEGLAGRLPQDLRISRLSVGDGGGVWLTVEDLALAWRPLAVVSGLLDVDALEARRVHLARLPQVRAEPSAEPGGSLEPPLDLALRRLAVDEILLEEPVLGQRVALSLRGEAATRGLEEMRSALTVERTDGIDGTLEAEGTYRPDGDRLTLSVAFREPAGGLVSALIDEPELPALALDLNGEGPLSDWRGRLSADLGPLARLEGDLTLARGRGLRFALEGTGDSARAAAALPWLSGVQSLALAGTWGPEEAFTLERAELEGASARLALSGSLDTRSRALRAEARAELLEPDAIAAYLP